eukprot:jgi/Hompol1/729/HPOL_002569-RA
MVLIKAAIERDSSTGDNNDNLGNELPRAFHTGASLVVTATSNPLMAPLRVPFRSHAAVRSASPTPTLITIHKDTVGGADEGDEAAAWFSAVLGISVRLFVKHPDFVRSLSKKHTPSPLLFDHAPQTAFADGFPALLVSEASIADIRHRLSQREKAADALRTFSLLNFRPNIVVKGCTEPFEEDTWLRIDIGQAQSADTSALGFIVTSRCTRCTVPSNCIETASLGTHEVTKLVTSYRRVDPGAKFEGCVGVNLANLSKQGIIRVDDIVRVLEKGIHDRRGIWQSGVQPISFEASAVAV